jgi:hypothetical protein
MPFRLGEQNKTINIYIVDDENDGIDISAATTKQFIFRKQDGSETTVNATFISGGTGGGLTYTVTSTSFFDVKGKWSVQAIVSAAATVWKSEVAQFEVKDNL